MIDYTPTVFGCEKARDTVEFITLQKLPHFWRIKLLVLGNDTNKEAFYRHLANLYYTSYYGKGTPMLDEQIVLTEPTIVQMQDYGVLSQVAVRLTGGLYKHNTLEQMTILFNRARQEVVFLLLHQDYWGRIDPNKLNQVLLGVFKRQDIGTLYGFQYRKDSFQVIIGNDNSLVPFVYLASSEKCKQYANHALDFFNEDINQDGLLDFGFKGTLFDYCGKRRFRTETDTTIQAKYSVQFYYLSQYDEGRLRFIPVHLKQTYYAIEDDWIGSPSLGKFED